MGIQLRYITPEDIIEIEINLFRLDITSVIFFKRRIQISIFVLFNFIMGKSIFLKILNGFLPFVIDICRKTVFQIFQIFIVNGL